MELTAKKKPWRERLRSFLEPYALLARIIPILLVTFFAVVYLFTLIAIILGLAAAIGNQNAQLVVGMISALGTIASAYVAYRLYRNSSSGADITVALEDPSVLDISYSVARTRFPEDPAGGTLQ